MSRPFWPACLILFVPIAATGDDAVGTTRSFHNTFRATSLFSEPAALRRDQPGEADLTGFFESASRRWGSGRLSMPLSHDSWKLDGQRSLSVNALGIRWEHTVGSTSQFALSAHYGDGQSTETDRRVLTGSAAMLSWSSLFGNDSRLTGRLYIGDQEARDRMIGFASRRYLGMDVEGTYSLWRDHSPFAGFSWRRNDYQSGDAGVAGWVSGNRIDSFSRIAAGWSWQIQPNWDFRAEANYRVADDGYEWTDVDRTQLYFSTRFGFR